MIKTLFALGAAAIALSAAPASAQHYRHHGECGRWHHHRCMEWHHMSMQREAEYRVGYSFGPSFGYTDFDALPQPVVTRYKLRPGWRYVNENGRLYVVNPHTYRVTRVITIP